MGSGERKTSNIGLWSVVAGSLGGFGAGPQWWQILLTAAGLVVAMEAGRRFAAAQPPAGGVG